MLKTPSKLEMAKIAQNELKSVLFASDWDLPTMGFQPRTSRSLTRSTAHTAIRPFSLLNSNRCYFSNNLYFGVRAREHFPKTIKF